jgi:hypothetical protein
VFSLFPIYTEESLVYIEELEGNWKSDEGILQITPLRSENVKLDITVTPGDDEILVLDGDTITDKKEINAYYSKMFTEELKEAVPEINDKAYLFTFIENEDSLYFKSRIAKIGNEHYLDLYPIDGQVDENLLKNLFPVHTFMKIKFDNDQVEIVEFDNEKLKDLFRANQIRLRHEDVDGSIVITAKPTEIQKFIKSYSKDQSVFKKGTVYNRVNS